MAITQRLTQTLLEDGSGEANSIRSFLPANHLASLLLGCPFLWLSWFAAAILYWIYSMVREPPSHVMEFWEYLVDSDHAQGCHFVHCLCLCLVNGICVVGLFAMRHHLAATHNNLTDGKQFISKGNASEIRTFSARILALSLALGMAGAFIFPGLQLGISEIPLACALVDVLCGYLPVTLSCAVVASVILTTWKVSEAAVEDIIDRIDQVAKKEISPNFVDLTERFLLMDGELGSLWANAGSLLGTVMTGILVLSVMMWLVAVASYASHQLVLSIVIASVAFGWNSAYMLLLLPLAHVTDKCNSMHATSSSLRRAVGNLAAVSLSDNSQVELQLFVMTVDRTPCGVDLPLIGQVSTSMLVSKASILVTLGPVLLHASSGLLNDLSLRAGAR